MALEGAEKLGGSQSVTERGQAKGDGPLPKNESVTPERVIELRRGLKPGQLREGAF